MTTVSDIVVDITVEDLTFAMKALQLQPYQKSIAGHYFQISTAGQANDFYDCWRSGIREGEFTLEVEMKGADPFDPFKVEAGCAHPDDYREPLPYYGAPPSDDEWLCSGCGYWKKGSSFGVTPLPKAEPLTDEELEENLKKQSKRFDPGQWMNFPDSYPVTIGHDLSATDSITAQFPVMFPRIPMSNSASSYKSITTLIQEMERSKRSSSFQFAPDIHVAPGGGVIDELRVMTRGVGPRDITDTKDILDAVYAMEYGTHYLRAPRVFFEADPVMMSSLSRIYDTPAGPMIRMIPGQPSMLYKLIGLELEVSRALPRNTLSLTCLS
jgi:hypothetical protein